MGNYIDETDVKNWPSGLASGEAAEIIDKAEKIIEKGCQDYFYEKSFDIEINGNDKSRVILPVRPKILSVAYVWVDGCLLSPSWYDYDEKSVYVDLRAAMNELQDGAFEKWESATDPAYWIATIAGTSAVKRNSAKERNGTYCLELEISAANDDAYVYQDFNMDPNKEYTLDIYYYMSVALKTARWMLRDLNSNVWLQSNGSWTDSATWNTLANKTSYYNEEVDFHAYPLYGKYRLYLDRLVAASSSIYFDDISIKHKEGAGVSDPEYLYRMRTKGALFPRGYSNVRVVGTYGWATTPEAVKQAAVIFCEAENDPTLYPKTFKSEKIGDYSYTKADEFKWVTGIYDADLLLQNYVSRRMVVVAA